MYEKWFYILIFAYVVYVIPSTRGASKGVQIGCADNESTSPSNECCIAVAGYNLTCETGFNITQFTCAAPYMLYHYFRETRDPNEKTPLVPEPGTVCIQVEKKYQDICLITTSVSNRQICQGFNGTTATGNTFDISPRCIQTECLYWS